MKRTHRAVLLSALLAVALTIGVARAEILEQILVKVNGEIFTKTDLEQLQVAALRQRGQQVDLKGDPSDEQLRKALNEITPQIMVDAVDQMLIVQRGKELGYKLSDEQFKTVLDNIKKENKLESDEQFQAALKQENMSMTDLRRNLEKQMIVTRVQQNEVFGRVGVSEEEARKYYDLERLWKSAEKVRPEQLLVGKAKPAATKKTAARKSPARKKATPKRKVVKTRKKK